MVFNASFGESKVLNHIYLFCFFNLHLLLFHYRKTDSVGLRDAAEVVEREPDQQPDQRHPEGDLCQHDSTCQTHPHAEQTQTDRRKCSRW